MEQLKAIVKSFEEWLFGNAQMWEILVMFAFVVTVSVVLG